MKREEIIQLIDEIINKERSRMVHISLNNHRFYNGLILSRDDDVLNFNDDKLGFMEIFISQIVNIEAFVEKK